ncbi:MAG: ribonuclease D [Candidatus Heimdallarchaeota archaeon]|nr:ribonuclease D [Candidatus Heimdallarchaeota archaeon]
MQDKKSCKTILERAMYHKIVSVDIESNSMYVYHERIALIQLHIDNQTYLIDTIVLGLPEELIEILGSDMILKVFQDMNYDQSILLKEYNCEVNNVFDISIADKIIQETDQSSSMEKLIFRYLHKEMKFSKKQQKSNWGLRPLNAKQLEYAANDVRFLEKIMYEMDKILEKDYRKKFFIVYMRYLKPVYRERIYNSKYVYKLQKKYGIEDLEVLSRLHHLLIALDKAAEKINKPPHWLLPDATLFNIALSNPQNLGVFIDLSRKTDGLQADREIISENVFMVLNNKQLIEPNSNRGQSIKRWEYLGDNNHNSKYHPENVIKIKNWRSMVAKKLKILRGMVLDKRPIASYSVEIADLEKNIIFPGIPTNYHQLFLEDLYHFIDSGESMLSVGNFLN